MSNPFKKLRSTETITITKIPIDSDTDVRGLGRKVKKEASISSSAQAISIVVDLLAIMILARLLSPTDYGLFAAGFLIIALCDLLREVGVGSSIIQLPDLTVNDQRTGLTISVITAVFVVVVIQLTSAMFAQFMNMPELENIVRLLSLVALVQSVSLVSQGILLRHLKSGNVAIIELGARSFSQLVVGVGLAFLGLGYWALVTASLAEAIIVGVGLTLLAKPCLRPGFNSTAAKRLLVRGSGFAVSRIMTFIALNATPWIVGKYAGAATLGIYSRASKLMNLPTNLYTKVADRVVFPAMARVQHEPERLTSGYLKGLELTALIGIPLSVSLFILAPELISVFLGPKWKDVVPVFSVLALGTYFRLIARVSGSLLRATASIKRLILCQTVYAGLTLGGALWTVQFGITAVAWSIVVAAFLWCVLISGLACRSIGVSLRKVLATHSHGVILAALTSVFLAPTTILMRASHLESWLTLFIIGIGLTILGALLIIIRPSKILGSEGKKIADQLARLAHRIASSLGRRALI